MLEPPGWVTKSLSMMIPLVPPVTGAAVSGDSLVNAITQPAALVGQFLVTPQKKKSVPPYIFGLKYSVTGLQRAAVLVEIWTELPGCRTPPELKLRR